MLRRTGHRPGPCRHISRCVDGRAVDTHTVTVATPIHLSAARIGHDQQLESLYTAIGDFFKQDCSGKWGYVFTGNFDLAKKVGLRTNQRIELYNSTIECRLLEYELY
jgi:hypothetical protein